MWSSCPCIFARFPTFRALHYFYWTSNVAYKTNAQIAKELKITQILDKLLEYKRNWIQHVNRMPRNRLPRVMKRYSPTGRRNHGRPLKRLLDTWDRNGSTSGPSPWQIYDDDNSCDRWNVSILLCFLVLVARILFILKFHDLNNNDWFVLE